MNNASSGIVQKVAAFPAVPFDTTITVGPFGTVRSSTAAFSFAASEPVLRFTYRLDGGAPVETTQTAVSFPGLSTGAHTFSVFATDLAGNVDPTPATRAWIVDPNYSVAGTVDPGFQPSANGTVLETAVQPDGKILIGGDFDSVNSRARSRLALIDASGAVDFTRPFNVNASADGSVKCLAVQPDGKILLGGSFANVNSTCSGASPRLRRAGCSIPRSIPAARTPPARCMVWRCNPTGKP